MTELSFLHDLVLVFAVSVGVVAVLRRVGIPSIAGLLVAGALIGPHALGLLRDVHRVEVLAEVGVVLLLFGVGLELSLAQLRRLWRGMLLGGGLQVGLTVAAAAGLARWYGLGGGAAVFVGFLVAVSSTAIVLRALEARGEIDAPHGRLVLGVLIFQDLCVVPMMLVLPVLAGASHRLGAAALAAGKAALVVAGVVLAARLVVPGVLRLVARTRQRDLFVLTVFLICLGTAWAVGRVGVSLALGAFLAGLVVGGSEFRHQALADLIPFREVLASVFFVSVGMLLEPRLLWARPGQVLALFGVIVAGKLVLVFVAAMVLRLPLRVCALGAVALAQVGEFSFVLLQAARGTPLIDGSFAAVFTAAAILSMLVTPLALALAPRLAAALGRVGPLRRLARGTAAGAEAQPPAATSGHTIVAGWGPAGRRLTDALVAAAAPVLVVDLNVASAREALAMGLPAYYGDITHEEVVGNLHPETARALVVVINDPDAAARAVLAARRRAPGVWILVRTRYAADEPTLRAAGADEVVVDEVESAVEVTRRVLRRAVAPEVDQDALLRAAWKGSGSSDPTVHEP